MEQVGFIGAIDKKDLLIACTAVLNYLGKKTLIVDATSMQRFRYVVPMTSSMPQVTYVSEYNGTDIALGFMNLNQVAQYLRTDLQYDYVLIDSDNLQTLNSFGIPLMKRIFYVTSYDTYDMNRGIELLNSIRSKVVITKVAISAELNSKQQQLLNYTIGKNSNISWNKDVVEIQRDVNDERRILENQYSKTFSAKAFSTSYKYGLEYLIAIFTENKIPQKDIQTALKKL